MNDTRPSFRHGQSDGGPGIWKKETTPQKGAEYQEHVTKAPKDTEYVVKTDIMPSGKKKFDGYDPETNTLIDAKDWDGWPPEGQR
ncbi:MULTISPECIES: Tox-REase-5 domain-containing protein [Aquimarina]|uniref:Tox-REase-5 domain-containing protein n=1 Tax=Aquimarina TaxID=290174 RepID=UPI001304ED3B|nr:MULTISPECIES: Tox-REase-5 domain-containing protein [Aquimarina]